MHYLRGPGWRLLLAAAVLYLLLPGHPLLVLAVFGIVAYLPRTALPLYVLMPVVAGFGAVVAVRGLVHARTLLTTVSPTASTRP